MSKQPSTQHRFKPHPWIAGGNIQTLLPRIGPAKLRNTRLKNSLGKNSQEYIIDCTNGAQLHGLYTGQATTQAPLIIFLHGWEGSAESSYLVSAAHYLYCQGFAIFRLHMRDHGPSHHLNREVFHCLMLEETVDAIRHIGRTFAASSYALCGFSLGGNFAIRIAAAAQQEGLNLQQVCAINPLIDPQSSANAVLQKPIYHYYFLRKWKRSLLLKHTLFEGLIDKQRLLSSKNYSQLTDYFIETLTPFNSAQEYYQLYAINQAWLENCAVPLAIYLSQNDPIIPFRNNYLKPTQHVSLHITQSGGHCGYQQNIFGKSWIDKQIFLQCKHLLESKPNLQQH